MISFFTQQTIGVYNDLTSQLLLVWLNKTGSTYLVGFPHGYETTPFTYSPQFLGDIILRIFHTLFNPFLANNLLIVSNIALTLFFTHKLFRTLRFSREIVWFLSISYTFSPYFLYRVISVSQMLYFTFVFPLLFYLLLTKVRPLLIGLFLTFVFYLSNYYGYFCFITTLFFYTSHLLVSFFKKTEDVRKSTLQTTKTITTIVTVIIITVILPHAHIASLSTHVLGNYNQESIQEAGLEKTIPVRNIEGFFNYTFRPWYFVLPPTDSLFLGDFSKNVYKDLSATNYFLTLNYDVDEAGGSFMGYTYLLLAAIPFALWKKLKDNHKEIILTSTLVILLLLSISGPPFFTISGNTFYTPNALLYYIMPAFRVLVRLSVVIFLLVLILSGYGLQNIQEKVSSHSFRVLMALLVLLGVMQFSVEVPILNGNEAPTYIQKLTDESKTPTVAIFPNNVYEAHFWLPYKGIALANPQYFRNNTYDADTFTEKLLSPAGIKQAQESEIEKLIVFTDKIDEEEREKTTNYFDKALEKEQSIDTVIIYKFPED